MAGRPQIFGDDDQRYLVQVTSDLLTPPRPGGRPLLDYVIFDQPGAASDTGLRCYSSQQPPHQHPELKEANLWQLLVAYPDLGTLLHLPIVSPIFQQGRPSFRYQPQDFYSSLLSQALRFFKHPGEPGPAIELGNLAATLEQWPYAYDLLYEGTRHPETAQYSLAAYVDAALRVKEYAQAQKGLALLKKVRDFPADEVKLQLLSWHLAKEKVPPAAAIAVLQDCVAEQVETPLGQQAAAALAVIGFVNQDQEAVKKYAALATQLYEVGAGDSILAAALAAHVAGDRETALAQLQLLLQFFAYEDLLPKYQKVLKQLVRLYRKKAPALLVAGYPCRPAAHQWPKFFQPVLDPRIPQLVTAPL